MGTPWTLTSRLQQAFTDKVQELPVPRFQTTKIFKYQIFKFLFRSLNVCGGKTPCIQQKDRRGRPTESQNVVSVPNPVPSPITVVVSRMSKANHMDVMLKTDQSASRVQNNKFFNHRKEKMHKRNPDTSLGIVTKIMEARPRDRG